MIKCYIKVAINNITVHNGSNSSNNVGSKCKRLSGFDTIPISALQSYNMDAANLIFDQTMHNNERSSAIKVYARFRPFNKIEKVNPYKVKQII